MDEIHKIRDQLLSEVAEKIAAAFPPSGETVIDFDIAGDHRGLYLLTTSYKVTKTFQGNYKALRFPVALIDEIEDGSFRGRFDDRCAAMIRAIRDECPG